MNMKFNGKARIENRNDGLRISLPTRKHWFALAIGTLCFFLWLSLYVQLVDLFAGSLSLEFNLFNFIFLYWTLIGVFLLLGLLWGYFGREIVKLENEHLILEKSVFGFGWKKKLDIHTIRNIRNEKIAANWLNIRRKEFWGLGGGKIRFDYGMRTYSFGQGIDDAESEYLIQIFNDSLNGHIAYKGLII
ncbi:MAG: hypothetical protein IPI45_06085 [Saprospiraceae bacterium]|nr:hypothetical protein [Saprospiraceae bacterium]MBK7914075.1 hypothetical protein [Saprospiraceae bacterium]